MTVHPLDNHLWKALNGPLARYSRAIGRVRLLSPDIGRVCALEEVSPANISELASILSAGEEVLVIAPEPLRTTQGLDVLAVKPVLQMVAERPTPVVSGVQTVQLRPADLAQMMSLVDLARPGPLGPRALELGSFRGIFNGASLVAMAGERLRVDRYTEVASVCTHPDYRGRGYAKAVVTDLMREIVNSGRKAFLGVDDGNTAAVQLYQGLGFTYRTTFYLSFVRHPFV